MHLINPSVLNLALAGVLGSVAAAAVAEPNSDFEAQDRNGDAKISLEEFQARGGEARAFRQSDADRDAKLTRDEFIKSAAGKDHPQSSQPVDDAVVTAKVKALLLKDESVKGLEVDVETHDGTVLLSGLVRNPAHITQAEKIARNVEGVKDVKNELKIKG